MSIPNILSLEQGIEAIQSGKVILYPTETFYAIGCDAFNGEAVAEIYRIKQRSAYFPLPLIVPDVATVETLAASLSKTAVRLMETFWPGPLTLLLSARKDLPSFMLRGSEYVAVRLSSHACAQRLARGVSALTASSANMSGFPPAWHPDELCQELLAACEGIVTEAPLPKGGAPSTIVRIDEVRGKEKVCIRRAGAVTKKDLESADFIVM